MYLLPFHPFLQILFDLGPPPHGTSVGCRLHFALFVTTSCTLARACCHSCLFTRFERITVALLSHVDSDHSRWFMCLKQHVSLTFLFANIFPAWAPFIALPFLKGSLPTTFIPPLVLHLNYCLPFQALHSLYPSLAAVLRPLSVMPLLHAGSKYYLALAAKEIFHRPLPPFRAVPQLHLLADSLHSPHRVRLTLGRVGCHPLGTGLMPRDHRSPRLCPACLLRGDLDIHR